MDRERRIAGYASAYAADYGFESILVRYRWRKCIETIRAADATSVLEIGCGQELLFGLAVESGLAVDRWVVVEPAAEFFAVAAKMAETDDRFVAIEGFFEDRASVALDAFSASPDIVLLSGVLNEVADPVGMLRTAASVMSERSLLHVDTANAYSLHRRLGRAMGLVDDVHRLTERNRRLAQFTVYDSDVLVSLIERAGLVVESRGGYFIKPFAHAQMEACADVLTPEVLDGLYTLGMELPELAVEIFVDARTAG